MNVTLINYTQQARETLIFTKNTRLTMSPALFDDICKWPEEKKKEEIKYISETIPSSWEFVTYIFLVERVSRAYTHQQVRTRSASYAQQTLRVLNAGDFEYVFTEKNLSDTNAVREIQYVLDVIKKGYAALRGLGQPIEDARGILPTNIATNIVCQFNLRTIADLAASRTGGRTQGEYQEVVNAMIDAVMGVHPWAGDFLFGTRQRDYFAEIEAFAKDAFPDLVQRGRLLKIVDKMRKS